MPKLPDESSSPLRLKVVNLFEQQPKVFRRYELCLSDRTTGTLSNYRFGEPNYCDHPGDSPGHSIALEQHPNHRVQKSEVFIPSIYTAIRNNADLWNTIALLPRERVADTFVDLLSNNVRRFPKRRSSGRRTGN